MRAIGAVAGLTLALAAAPAQAVVGGTPVPPGKMRAVANILIGGSFGCTGSLVGARWVLTAGHCGSATGALSEGLLPSGASFPPSEYTVKLGSVYADGRGGETHQVARVVVDGDYGIQNGTGNDVSLLELTQPSRIAPLRIAAVGERRLWRAGVKATVAGFGTTSEDGATTDRMQQTRVPIVSDAGCAKAYPGGLSKVGDDGSFDARTMLCAGYLKTGGHDTCQGDSGGPLLVAAPHRTVRLAGATSFGAGCGRPGKPGVYARLAEGPIRAFVRRVVPSAFAPEPGRHSPSQ